MFMQQPQNLIAVTPGGDITDEMLAGCYVLYSFEEKSVPLAKARKAFKDHGLDVSRLPEVRRLEHVMMDACTQAQRIHVNGKKTEIRAQQVGRDGKFLIYQMTKHVHDLKNRVIEHPKALRVLFNFEDGTLGFERLDGASDEDVKQLEDEIQDYFDTHQAMLPGRGLRTVMRHYIEAAGAEQMGSGAYFMPKLTKLTQNSKLRDHHGSSIGAFEFVASIQGALRDIYGYEPMFHPIPCINDEGQRAFLKRKFIENCAEALKAHRDECLKLIDSSEDRKRAFRTDVTARIVQQRKDIEERRKQFAEILGETLEELDRDMTLADKALTKYLTEVNS